MQSAFFIAWQDVRYQLKQGSTLLWLFVMPPVFFYFIGTVTGGFSSGMSGASATPLRIEAESPGFLQAQIDMRLRDNDFAPEWTSASVPEPDADARRTLTIGDDLSERILAGEQVPMTFDTRSSELSRDFEIIRVQRSLLTALADIVVARSVTGDSGVADSGADATLSQASLDALNATPRIWQLEVAPAGERLEIPSGFEQTIPGILVMFTLLVLLTSGGSMLVLEREQGLLRRLASAPISRTEVVTGKWIGRMVLASLQIGFALVVGTLLFRMEWGPDIGMVMLILAAWAALCASAGLLLGSLVATEGQATGLGVLLANALAALGGCWWPIEITPGWMQFVQKLVPTGWTMDALHKLISFQAGAAATIPHLVTLLAGALLLGAVAARRFRYQ